MKSVLNSIYNYLAEGKKEVKFKQLCKNFKFSIFYYNLLL